MAAIGKFQSFPCKARLTLSARFTRRDVERWEGVLARTWGHMTGRFLFILAEALTVNHQPPLQNRFASTQARAFLLEVAAIPEDGGLTAVARHGGRTRVG